MTNNLISSLLASNDDPYPALIIEWQSNLRKELEAERSAERLAAINDSTYMHDDETELSEEAGSHGEGLESYIEAVGSNPSDVAIVRLPEQARKFGLLTRADVQAEHTAIPLVHGLICKGQLTMIAGPSGCGKSLFQLHL